jgi:hypothetical protein
MIEKTPGFGPALDEYSQEELLPQKAFAISHLGLLSRVVCWHCSLQACKWMR